MGLAIWPTAFGEANESRAIENEPYALGAPDVNIDSLELQESW